ncbi:MAG TPA: universal stress protein [Candidatus Bathyarchaeia archaeon]|nr:universal stress protein [Candidatus Bathyarchaeia archaeon]
MALRRVLCATDFSRASRPAFRMALAVARRAGARLLLLHVLTPPSPFVSGRHPAPASYLALLEAARRQARRQLASWLARAQAARVRAEARLVEGGPAEQIRRVSVRWRAGLIVIGTHGRTGVRRVVMGSVADQVVRSASRPVLTVRGR